MGKRVDDRCSRDILHWDCQGPSGQAVDGGEQVSKPVGFWHRDDVHIPMLESLGWDLEMSDWRDHMPLDL